ncbi:hypothetical protein [Streptomyces sp. enrichment culture]|uniref:hypothetical protein n=1 Tax=Streptomyces sp. enrichment culture TaxID=1795815 RepID=UPI003F563142
MTVAGLITMQATQPGHSSGTAAVVTVYRASSWRGSRRLVLTMGVRAAREQDVRLLAQREVLQGACSAGVVEPGHAASLDHAGQLTLLAPKTMSPPSR